MPIRDLAARNSSLDNDYGTTAGPNAPASHLLALYVGDPFLDGYETAGGGYARVAVPAASWGPADGGMKTTTAPVQFPATTAAWDQPVTHWALYDAAGVVMWDTGPLTEPLDVTGSGPGPTVTPTVFYDDSATIAQE